MTTLLIIALSLAFISGAPLFAIMVAGTALGAVFSQRGFDINFNGAINKMFRISSRDEIEVLSTIPMFIGAGYILAESKTADRLVRFANALLGWVPGGLAIVTISTCALFTVFTGASGVTIIALGGVLMPALVRQGYPKKFSMGLIAGTGSVGLLFPPALPLFIFGTVYGLTGLRDLDGKPWSTLKFLAAGIIPGMVLVGMLFAVAITVAVVKKLPRQKFVMNELGSSFIKALPELFIPFGVILALASGFGPPEVAALTVLYVVVLEAAIYRTITPRQLWGLSGEAMAMIGAIFAIIFASTAFTDFMVNAEVPRKLVVWTQDHVHSKIVFLLAINVILLIVGTVMDIFSAIVVVLPLIAPIARSYGIDPYHVGVIFLLNLEVGYLHPPVGLNLFLTSVKFQRPITEVMWATIPFLVTMIVALLVISYVPQLTTASVRMGQLIGMSPMEFEPVRNLREIVQDGIAESKVTEKELKLVDAAGTPLVAHPVTFDAVCAKGSHCVDANLVDTAAAKKVPVCDDGARLCAPDASIEGKQLVRRFGDCRKAPPPPKQPSETEAPPKSEEERNREIASCRKPFFAISDCKTSGGDVTECSNRAIAKWVVETYNEDLTDETLDPKKEIWGHPAQAVIALTELELVDTSGDPLTVEVNKLDASGKPVMKKVGEVLLEEKEDKPLVGKDGKKIKVTLAWCDQLKFPADREKCRNLFVSASACKINFEKPDDECIEDKCKTPEGAKPDDAKKPDDKKPDDNKPAEPPALGSGSGSGSGSATAAGSGSGSAAAGSGSAGSGSAATNAAAGSGSGSAAGSGSAGVGAGSGAGSAAPPPVAGDPCKRKAYAECIQEPIASCIVEAAKSWTKEKVNQTIVLEPKLKGGNEAKAAVEDESSGGCAAATGGPVGLLFVGAALVILRRRKPRRAA